MSRFLALLALFVLLAGCGKKPAPSPAPEPEVKVAPPGKAEPEPVAPSDRDLWIVDLKSTNRDKRKDAIEALSILAETDEATRDALVDVLRDRTTDGVGKTHPSKITSTREAAAIALLKAGAKGEAALGEKGIVPLREGLVDKDAAVREHTAHVIGLLGPIAKPLSGQLLRAAADDKSEQVRAIAFDSLRAVGVTDVATLAALMNRKEPADVKRRAAEIISVLPEFPPGAMPSLLRALDDDDEVIRISAGIAIDTAGVKNASKEAPAYLVGAIKKGFPPMFDEKLYRPDDPQYVYFTALGKQGKHAVQPAMELLKHKNWVVRYHTLLAFAEIGKDAKEAAPLIRDLFSDPEVALEAVVTLYRVGDDEFEKTLDLLATALASIRPQSVLASLDAITRIGPAAKRLYPAALAHLASSEAVVRFAAIGLVASLESAEAAKQVPALAKLATDPEALNRRRAGSVLEKLGPTSAPAAEAIGTALKTETDEAVREQFVDALLAMGPSAKSAVAGLASLIANPDASLPIRLKVVSALIQADPASKATADALIAASKDRDAMVRKAAAGALGKLNPLPDDARAALVKLLKSDSNGAVQLAAARGLAVAGPRAGGAKAELEAAANSKLPATAFWAKVAIIGVTGDLTKAGPVVRDGLKDRNGLVRAAAADALALVGPAAGDVPQLIRISRESTTGAGEAAAHTLGLIGPAAKDAVPRLIELVSIPDTPTRIAAAEALGRIGLPSAAPAIPKIRDAIRADPGFSIPGHKALEKLGVKTDGMK